jgi:hypothetical protein
MENNIFTLEEWFNKEKRVTFALWETLEYI